LLILYREHLFLITTVRAVVDLVHNLVLRAVKIGAAGKSLA
jgi:hypothetical protein